MIQYHNNDYDADDDDADDWNCERVFFLECNIFKQYYRSQPVGCTFSQEHQLAWPWSR